MNHSFNRFVQADLFRNEARQFKKIYSKMHIHLYMKHSAWDVLRLSCVFIWNCWTRAKWDDLVPKMSLNLIFLLNCFIKSVSHMQTPFRIIKMLSLILVHRDLTEFHCNLWISYLHSLYSLLVIMRGIASLHNSALNKKSGVLSGVALTKFYINPPFPISIFFD